MDWSKLHKLVEAVNTYYAFAVLMYVAVLYVSSRSHIFLWALLAATPLLAMWTGYLLKSYVDNRNQKHGFRVLSDATTYEIMDHNRYKLHVRTTIKAEANRMMAYPIGYQWTGEGKGMTPMLADPDQKLMGVVLKYDSEKGTAYVEPYKETVSSEDDWNYWFVALGRALYKGDTADIKYSQDFYDPKKKAKPCLYYMVNSKLEKLELNVKFSPNALPARVTGSYFKLNDRRHSYVQKGVAYDPDKQWATWTIDKPKYGYCYRIDWQ